MSNFYVCQKCGEDFTPTGDERHLTVSVAGGWSLDLAEHYEPCGGLGVDRFPELVRPKGAATVPGTLTAHYAEGRITDLTFTPHGGSAGYFGPTAEHAHGEEWDYSDDGPFWRAMRDALAGVGAIEWTE